jgi:hypothetical protein
MQNRPGKDFSAAALSVQRNTENNLNYYKNLVDFYESDDSDALLKLRSFAVYTPRQVISDYLARYFLFEKIVEVPGSIVECGVFNGQGLMSYANFSSVLEPNNFTRKIVGFDTFAGFEAVGENDSRSGNPMVVNGGMVADSYSRINSAIKLYDANRFLGHLPKVEVVKGNILETLDQYLEDNPHLLVSLLYLDLDIYEPTKYVLQTLLKRVPKGGVVAFDELNFKDFPGETLALLDSLDIATLELKRVPFCSRISYFIR